MSITEKIANERGDMAMLCCGYCVNDIFISAMICRRSKVLGEKVKHINLLLKLISEENGYFFIDNSNTEIRDLWKDGIHPLESRKSKFAQNFIYFLNNSFWLSPYDNFLEVHTHENFEPTYSKLSNAKNYESTQIKAF